MLPAYVQAIHLKDADKIRHPAKQVFHLVQEGRYPNFIIDEYTRLWQNLNARRDGVPHGKPFEYRGLFVFFENWIDRGKEHCAENGDRHT